MSENNLLINGRGSNSETKLSEVDQLLKVSDQVHNFAEYNPNTEDYQTHQQRPKTIFKTTVAHLPTEYRKIVELYYLERLSLQEIADHLGMLKPEVAKRHCLALRLLRERAVEEGMAA